MNTKKIRQRSIQLLKETPLTTWINLYWLVLLLSFVAGGLSGTQGAATGAAVANGEIHSVSAFGGSDILAFISLIPGMAFTINMFRHFTGRHSTDKYDVKEVVFGRGLDWQQNLTLVANTFVQGFLLILWSIIPIFAAIFLAGTIAGLTGFDAAAAFAGGGEFDLAGFILGSFIFFGVATIVVLPVVIWKTVQYQYAIYLQADSFETEEQLGIFESIKASKELMKGHVWQYVRGLIPWVLIIAAVWFAFIGSIAGTISGLGAGVSGIGIAAGFGALSLIGIAFMVASVILGVLFSLYNVLFFDELTKQ